MSEDEFWSIADTFRDPRVWWIESDTWYKDTLWGKPLGFGNVNLKKKQIDDFKRRQNEIIKIKK